MSAPAATLEAAYEQCRLIHAEHGRTYYLATRLLPRARRPHVWALYAFARVADELVDDLEAPDPDALVTWSRAAMDPDWTSTSEEATGPRRLRSARHRRRRARLPT